MSKSLSRMRAVLRLSSVYLVLSSLSPLLIACGDKEPQNFAPLNYGYLNKLHLDVAHLEVVDMAPPGSTPGDISIKAPTPPQQALTQMAHDRLIAAGSEGNGVFTITKASILHAPGGTLLGELEAHIDVSAPSGNRKGYALAHITRTLTPGNKDVEAPSVLYALTAQMMQDMNVELEFQIKKSLQNWLVDASGASLKGAVQQQDIGPTSSNAAAATESAIEPANAPATPPIVAASPPSASTAIPATHSSIPPEPDAIFPLGEGSETDTPARKSPQPGVLTLPSRHF